MKGRGRDVIDVLYWNLPGGIEEKHKKYRSG
jgi:hypothetical protein